MHIDRVLAKNKLTLHQVSYKRHKGTKPPINMPGKVEMALLQDLEGNIKLSIPIEVDRDQLIRTQLGPLIADAVQHAIFGAITSPLKLVGAVFAAQQGGPMSIEPFATPPGLGRVVEAELTRVEALAQVLATRPGLGVRLTGTAGAGDVAALSLQQLAHAARQGQPLPEVQEEIPPSAQQRVVEALAAWEPGTPLPLPHEDHPYLDRYVTAVEITPDQLRQLARSRAQTVRDALIKLRGLDTARIQVKTDHISEIAADSTPGSSSGPTPGPSGVLVELLVP